MHLVFLDLQSVTSAQLTTTHQQQQQLQELLPLSIYTRTALYLGTPSQATQTYMHASGTEHQQQLQECVCCLSSPLSIYTYSPVPGHTLPSHTNIHACLRHRASTTTARVCLLSLISSLYMHSPVPGHTLPSHTNMPQLLEGKQCHITFINR